MVKKRHITYTISNIDFAYILIAKTVKGVCCIELSHSYQQLFQELKKRFKNCILEEDKNENSEIIREMLKQQFAPFSFPIDVQGTEFQKRVWEALQHIPYGYTRSYSDIADMIGKPKAVRAVANACGANKLAIVIPCHRVIAKDGSLGGYHWGSDIKRKLLENEGVIIEK